jgi:hypothetical protein
MICPNSQVSPCVSPRGFRLPKPRLPLQLLDHPLGILDRLKRAVLVQTVDDNASGRQRRTRQFVDPPLSYPRAAESLFTQWPEGAAAQVSRLLMGAFSPIPINPAERHCDSGHRLGYRVTQHIGNDWGWMMPNPEFIGESVAGFSRDDLREMLTGGTTPGEILDVMICQATGKSGIC